MFLPSGPASSEQDRDPSTMEPADGASQEDTSKRLNDDLVLFVRKRSEHEAPRYTARLKTILDIHQKRRKAGTAREHKAGRQPKAQKQIVEDATKENQDAVISKPRSNTKSNLSGSRDDVGGDRPRRRSRSFSLAPSDRCGRRRRRRKSIRKRRRRCSCGKKRRRRSRRRRSCRPRRRRSRGKRRQRRRRSSGKRRRRKRC